MEYSNHTTPSSGFRTNDATTPDTRLLQAQQCSRGLPAPSTHAPSQGFLCSPSASTGIDTLEEAMGRLGSLTIADTVPAQSRQHQPLARGVADGGIDELDMGSLRVVESAAAGDADQAKANGALVQCRSHRQQDVLQGLPSGGGPGGCCPSCGGRGQAGLGWGRAADGAWRDEEGRRLYTEQEVRDAIEQESRPWRDRAASLEMQLANMESEARAAFARADQAMAEMAEQLKASESKTYALSVHLAKSNRPSHLA